MKGYLSWLIKFSVLKEIFTELCQMDNSLYFMCNIESFVYLTEKLDSITIPLRARYIFCCSPVNIKDTLVTTMLLRVSRKQIFSHSPSKKGQSDKSFQSTVSAYFFTDGKIFWPKQSYESYLASQSDSVATTSTIQHRRHVQVGVDTRCVRFVYVVEVGKLIL